MSESLSLKSRIEISELLKKGEDYLNQDVTVAAWVRSVRKSKNLSFVVLNDGSMQESLQVIVEDSLTNYEEVSSMNTGTAVLMRGEFVPSGGKGQAYELQAKEAQVIGPVNDGYPLQKKATSLEFLRENAHLRPRTKLFSAVFRIRHALSMATHQFFNERNFYYLHSPVLTGIDAEGAGEMFSVTTYDLGKIDKIPQYKGQCDFSKDYFGKQTSLCVTGQLEAETFAEGMGKVYTFGPTFRAENSNTARHLAEFWMIEPEAAFLDLEGCADLAADYVKFLIRYALENCHSELQAIQGYLKFSAKRNNEKYEDHLPMIESVANSEFLKVSYTEAIEILQNSKKKFQFPTVWGEELQTEHERFLTEEYFKRPVVVTDYPKDCKAFYMKQNDPDSHGRETVRAMDVLVPGVGEIIGGSQREESLEKLETRIQELRMNKDALWWYLDLRRFGSVPHSGFGLGFERAMMYISGMKNIRDVIPFPRTPKNCDF